MLSNNRTKLIVWWMANVFVFVLVMIWSLAQLVSVCLVEGQWVSTQWAHRWGYVCKEVWMPWYMTPIALQILLITWAILISACRKTTLRVTGTSRPASPLSTVATFAVLFVPILCTLIDRLVPGPASTCAD